MSETGVKEVVYGFYQALTLKNLDEIQRLFSDGASLSWGPYDFVGKERILTWANEFFELFPFISFKEKKLEVSEDTAKHEFMIAFLTAQGRKGWLPCESTYTIKDGKILKVEVKLLHGFLAVSGEEVEKVKPHPTK
jgi:hypothetical protein